MTHALQFSLRRLFATLTAVALLSCSFSLYGWIGFVVCALAFVALVVGIVSYFLLLRIVLFGFAGICFWFLLVHRLLEGHECNVCHRYIIQERIEVIRIRVAFHELCNDPTLITLMASDLGFPCNHPDSSDWEPWEDYWGAYYCVHPFRGTAHLSVGSQWEQWYRDVVRPRLFAAQHDNPKLAEEFRQRVMLDRDRKYWTHFTDEILHIPEYDPDYNAR
jgi:hypothetical protein